MVKRNHSSYAQNNIQIIIDFFSHLKIFCDRTWFVEHERGMTRVV